METTAFIRKCSALKGTRIASIIQSGPSNGSRIKQGACLRLQFTELHPAVVYKLRPTPPPSVMMGGGGDAVQIWREVHLAGGYSNLSRSTVLSRQNPYHWVAGDLLVMSVAPNGF